MNQEMAIQTCGLVRSYGNNKAVDCVDLDISKGSVYGFLGLNGAGKSTTMRLLIGLLHRDEGKINILGLDPDTHSLEIKERVGYVPEVASFYQWMCVEEICQFVAHYRRGRWDHNHARSLMKRFDLDPKKKIRSLSKGQKAKTALLLALGFHPEVLILDEPTSGLDPISRREFFEGVLSEYQESGRTIFISSHLITELAGLIDTLGIIHKGRMLYSGASEAFRLSIRRVRMRFTDTPPTLLGSQNVLTQKIDGCESIVMIKDFDEASTSEQFKSLATSVEIDSLSLEDAFIEFLRPLHNEGRALLESDGQNDV